MRDKIELYASFSGKSKLHLLLRAVATPKLFLRGYKTVKSLPCITLEITSAKNDPLAEYFTRNGLLAWLRTLAQASLEIEKYSVWLSARSRRSVRHALRQAAKNALHPKVATQAQAAEAYLAIKKFRGEKPDLEIWKWAEEDQAQTTVAVCVSDAAGNTKAIAVGSVSGQTVLLSTCMSTGEGDYSRWLALASFIKQSNNQGAKRILSGSQLGLAKSHLEFQAFFGFESVNVAPIFK